MERLKKNKDIIVIGTIISILLLATTILKLKVTRFAYYWDNTTYYENSLYVISNFNQSFVYGIKAVIYSIFYTDYNYLAAIIPSVLMVIFGINRITYTIIITIFYYIPFIFIFLIVIKPLVEKCKYKNVYMTISTLTCGALIMYLNYMGYVDAGGLILILLLFRVTKKAEYKIKSNILIGIILMILFFFRRWYLFYIISFLMTLFLFDVYSFIKSNSKKEMFFKYFKKYLTIAFTMITIVILTISLNIILFSNDTNFKLQWNNFYLTKLLVNDYSNLYSAYSRPLTSDLTGIGNNIGYLIIGLTIFSTVLAIKNKKNVKEILFLIIQMLLCFTVFKRTQSHDVHHYLLYVINIMLIISYIFANSKKKITMIVVTLILCINVLGSIPICYENGIVKELKKYLLINNIDLNPVYRTDLEEFEKINDEITRLSDGGTKKIYINSSSSIFNDSMVHSYERTTGESLKIKSFILSVAHVDSRDGVPYTLKEADIVIVTDPDQFHHIGASNQKIITYVNNVFLDEQYSYIFENKFEKIETMNIGDIKVYFYKKTEEITNEEYNIFLEKGREFIQKQN